MGSSYFFLWLLTPDHVGFQKQNASFQAGGSSGATSACDRWLTRGACAVFEAELLAEGGDEQGRHSDRVSTECLQKRGPNPTVEEGNPGRHQA